MAKVLHSAYFIEEMGQHLGAGFYRGNTVPAADEEAWH